MRAEALVRHKDDEIRRLQQRLALAQVPIDAERQASAHELERLRQELDQVHFRAPMCVFVHACMFV
jgi:hypothetical protein